MAGFHTKTFLKHDDYMTPFSAWENITEYIPKDKIIWESFYGDGKSKEHLLKLGCKEVIHENIDFFEEDRGEVIISNPPFSLAKDIMPRLAQLDKPFIMLMPSAKINTKYVRDNFKNKKLQIIIPRRRIQFVKLVDGKEPEKQENKCNFDCFYYYYKLNLPKSDNMIRIQHESDHDSSDLFYALTGIVLFGLCPCLLSNQSSQLIQNVLFSFFPKKYQ